MTAIAPLIISLPIRTQLHRVVVAARGTNGALFFGPAPGHPPSGRFDSATGAFRVCYLADTRRGAFVESLARKATPPDVTSGIRSLAASDIAASAWASTTTTRSLRLADLRDGQGLAPLGLTGAVTMGDSHNAGRALSDSLHQLRPRLDGLYFRTRHDPAECAIALFDRATSELRPITVLMPRQNDIVALGTYLDWYRIALDD